jgi:hypothetical protein
MSIPPISFCSSLPFASSKLFRDGPTLLSLSYSEFFYPFPRFFVHYSVIYHCFPSVTYIGPFPLFIPLLVLVQYLPSIFFDPFHQSLPLCSFHLVFSSQFLSPLSPILPLKSPPKSIQSSLFSFIASSTRLLVVFISLLYIVIIFHHLFAYMNFSFHASFFFSLFLSFFFNLQFHSCYYSPGSSSLFSFLFLPLDLPICNLFFSLSNYLFFHLLFIPFLAGSSSLLLSFF